MLKFFYLVDYNNDISFPPYFYSLQTLSHIPPFSLSNSLPVSFSLIDVILLHTYFPKYVSTFCSVDIVLLAYVHLQG